LFEFIVPAVAEWGSVTTQKVGRWAAIAFILIVLPTNLYLWAWRFVELARHDYPFYLYKDETAALDWLRENSSPEDVVFSSIDLGQYVPAISGNTAFLAHWAQTVRFYDKRERVARFFDAAVADSERARTVHAFDVAYVLHGPAERALGGYDPATTSWLNLVYSERQVNVYSVLSDELTAEIGSGSEP
jgi:hypothetical protein